jgi:hypothetical protein
MKKMIILSFVLLVAVVAYAIPPIPPTSGCSSVGCTFSASDWKTYLGFSVSDVVNAVGVNGAPANHYWAIWVNENAIKGVSVGTPNVPVCTGATNEPTPCTNLADVAYSPLAGSSSIVTVGTVVTGTWGSTATPIAVASGGTGAANATAARTNLGLDTMATQAANAINATGGTISGLTSLSANDLTVSNVANMLSSGWRSLTVVTDYATAPASTSTLTMARDLTAVIPVGSPISYVIGGTTYYGQITALAAALMTIGGIALSGNVSNLKYGSPDKIRAIEVTLPGAYEAASSNTLIADYRSNFTWKKSTAYLVGYSVYSYTADSGTKGTVSVRINGNETNTTAGGLTVTAATTAYNTIVDINPTYYQVLFGQPIEITAVKNGTGDASYLTAILRFVNP